jgi:hypothetical protein
MWVWGQHRDLTSPPARTTYTIPACIHGSGRDQLVKQPWPASWPWERPEERPKPNRLTSSSKQTLVAHPAARAEIAAIISSISADKLCDDGLPAAPGRCRPPHTNTGSHCISNYTRAKSCRPCLVGEAKKKRYHIGCVRWISGEVFVY